jgi:hypothetical protein
MLKLTLFYWPLSFPEMLKFVFVATPLSSHAETDFIDHVLPFLAMLKQLLLQWFVQFCLLTLQPCRGGVATGLRTIQFLFV